MQNASLLTVLVDTDPIVIVIRFLLRLLTVVILPHSDFNGILILKCTFIFLVHLSQLKPTEGVHENKKRAVPV